MKPTPRIRVFCHPGLSYRSIFTPPTLPQPFAIGRARFYLRGSSALWDGLHGLGPPEGQSILFPSYHCGIELDVIRTVGFEVKFYRVDSDLQIDMNHLRRLVTAGTRALFVIHYFGFPHALDELKRWCSEFGLALIEDCAQALYAKYRGQPVGTFGDLATFSLHKCLPLPYGGILLTNAGSVQPPAVLKHAPFSFVALEMLWLIARDLLRSWVLNLDWCRRFLRLIARVVLRDEPPHARQVSSTQFKKEWAGVHMPFLSMWLFKRSPHQQVFAQRRSKFAALLRIVADCKRITPVIPALTDGACPAYFPVTAEGNHFEFIRFCRVRGLRADPYWADLHPEFPSELFPEARFLKQHVAVLPVHQQLDEKDMALIRQILMEWEHLEKS